MVNDRRFLANPIVAMALNYMIAQHVVLPEFWQNAEVVWAIDLECYKEEEGVG